MPGTPLSPQFLAHLRQIAPALSATDLSDAFLGALQTLAAALPGPPTSTDLVSLTAAFNLWRDQVREELDRALVRLDNDDPLLCPVSLFRPLGWGRLETAQTRALAWLLRPSEPHGFGDALLRALLASLTGEPTLELMETDGVVAEEAAGGGRLDIFGCGKWRHRGSQPRPWVLAIEAKVDAVEGYEQLGRYRRWLESQTAGAEVLCVFLTPSGWVPQTSGSDWQPLSFLDLARTLRAASADLRNRAGYHFLRYYLSGLWQDICGWPLPLRADCPDPYSVLRLLRAAPLQEAHYAHPR
jgi:hypothetical protein